MKGIMITPWNRTNRMVGDMVLLRCEGAGHGMQGLRYFKKIISTPEKQFRVI